MSVLRVSVEFEGTPEDVMTASQVVFGALNDDSFKKLRARSEVKVEMLSHESVLPPRDVIPLSDGLEGLELGVRSYNCLKRIGIETVGDLVEKSEEDLSSVPNLGRRGILEIIDALAAHGRRLRQT